MPDLNTEISEDLIRRWRAALGIRRLTAKSVLPQLLERWLAEVEGGGGTETRNEGGKSDKWGVISQQALRPENKDEARAVSLLLRLSRRSSPRAVVGLLEHLTRLMDESATVPPEAQDHNASGVARVVKITKRHGLSAPPPNFLGVAAEKDNGEDSGGNEGDEGKGEKD